MNIQVRIGERIAKMREKNKLTQLQLAKKIKMDRTFITHVEKGRRNLSVQSLAKIVKGLDTTFANFFQEAIATEPMTQTSMLHLTLKKQWFDIIANGEKKEEYRECKEYWSSWTDEVLIIFPSPCIAMYKMESRNSGCQPSRSRPAYKICRKPGKAWLNLDNKYM